MNIADRCGGAMAENHDGRSWTELSEEFRRSCLLDLRAVILVILEERKRLGWAAETILYNIFNHISEMERLGKWSEFADDGEPQAPIAPSPPPP